MLVPENQSPTVAVLLPCYNEEVTIGKGVRDFKASLPQADIYVYDNNSTDRTAEIAAAAGAIVRKEPRRGKGNVIRAMFEDIDADVYVMADGDDTYPADAAPAMVDKVLEGYDMVIGDRLSSTYFQENKRPFHNFGNRLVRGSINGLFHANVTDIMTGYRAFSFTFVKTYPVLSKGFEIETDMTIHAINRRMQVSNIVVSYRDRPDGSESKLNTYQDGARVLLTIARLYKNYKPFAFFGLLALILALVSTGFMIPVLMEFAKTGLVPRFPTLIACCVTMLAALLLFIAGLILSTLQEKDKRDFEFELQQVSDQYRRLTTEEAARQEKVSA